MGRRLFLACIPVVLAATVAAAGPEPAPGIISRAQFTSGIQDREPVDNLTELIGDTEMIYFFTELRDLTNQLVTHSWEYKGEVVAEIRFRVNGPRWRIWSNRTLTPDRNGHWSVVVMNADGEILAEKILDYNLGDPALGPASIY